MVNTCGACGGPLPDDVLEREPEEFLGPLGNGHAHSALPGAVMCDDAERMAIVLRRS